MGSPRAGPALLLIVGFCPYTGARCSGHLWALLQVLILFQLLLLRALLCSLGSFAGMLVIQGAGAALSGRFLRNQKQQREVWGGSGPVA